MGFMEEMNQALEDLEVPPDDWTGAASDHGERKEVSW